MKDIAVSSRYAQAVYEEASAQGITEAVVGDLEQLEQLLQNNKEFATFVETAALTVDEKLAVVTKLAKAGINRLTEGLLVVMTRNQRLGLLDAVIKAVRKLVLIEKGQVEVRVDYAAPATDNIRASLKAQLTKLTNKSVILKENVDPSLLGGMRVFVDSKLYDLSIRGKLDALKAGM
ncbi:MAG: ATP synthase F1 subunit delta [Deferribacteraceae bacterium]|jgi:F-type H+-transporting ATPase subunit delta|nr:ATP synthase F1 subunit delta [Deferribacteraceae bacterium]